MILPILVGLGISAGLYIKRDTLNYTLSLGLRYALAAAIGGLAIVGVSLEFDPALGATLALFWAGFVMVAGIPAGAAWVTAKLKSWLWTSRRRPAAQGEG